MSLASDFDRYVAKVKKACEDAQKEVAKEVAIEIKRETERLFAETINNEYYGRYKPRFYKRNNNMLSIYTVEIDSDRPTAFTMNFSDDGMTPTRRDGDTEYMYNTMFKGGWHGGADDGPLHPAIGVPYYRKYPPKLGYRGKPWRYWSRPAFRSNSPFDTFNRLLDEYIEKKREDFMDRVTKRATQAAEAVRW